MHLPVQYPKAYDDPERAGKEKTSPNNDDLRIATNNAIRFIDDIFGNITKQLKMRASGTTPSCYFRLIMEVVIRPFSCLTSHNSQDFLLIIIWFGQSWVQFTKTLSTTTTLFVAASSIPLTAVCVCLSFLQEVGLIRKSWKKTEQV
jgi:hypothetical protein